MRNKRKWDWIWCLTGRDMNVIQCTYWKCFSRQWISISNLAPNLSYITLCMVYEHKEDFKWVDIRASILKRWHREMWSDSTCKGLCITSRTTVATSALSSPLQLFLYYYPCFSLTIHGEVGIWWRSQFIAV